MTAGSSHEIVVGVDESAASWSALAWAAEAAVRRGAWLVVAHAVEVPTAPGLIGDTRDTARREAIEHGYVVIREAIERVSQSHPDLVASPRLAIAKGAALLGRLSLDAEVVVVGRTSPHTPQHFGLGSTAHRIAAKANSPVVIVPATPPVRASGIVVGVSDSAGGISAMRFACTEARSRRAVLHPIRSWSDHDAMVNLADQITFDQWREEQRALLDSWVTRARREFPDVMVEPELTSAPIYQALQRASRSASLVVVGCRRDDAAVFSRLGPVTSWVIEHAESAIAVVGYDAVQAVPERAGSAFGQLATT